MRDYVHQQHQFPSSVSSVSLDHLLTGSLAVSRRCPAKLWQTVQLALQPYLLCFCWHYGKSRKISCPFGPSCVLQRPATGCTIDGTVSLITAYRAGCREHRHRAMGVQERASTTCPTAPLWTAQASCSMEIHWVVLARTGTNSQQHEISPPSS